MDTKGKPQKRNWISSNSNNTQQNSDCRLYGDWYGTVNHMISKCSKLAQKDYKIRHDWVGKVICLELCKRWKFDHTAKWYVHNPESVLENETHKILWEFDIQTDHLISVRFWVWVWVLFNGISTPVGHLMPKRLFLISVIKIAVL